MSEMKDSHVNVVVSFKYIMQVKYHSSMRIIVLKSTVRLRIVPHFSSGIVERVKRERVKIMFQISSYFAPVMNHNKICLKVVKPPEIKCG